MKSWILLAPLLFACPLLPPALAQWGKLADEEQKKLMRFSADHERIDTLNEWSFWADGEPAAVYARAALELESRSPYPKGRGDSYSRLGLVATYYGDFHEARSYYHQSLDIRQAQGDSSGVLGCFANIGESYRRQSQYDSAIVILQQGLRYYPKPPLHIIVSNMHTSLGSAYRHKGFYARARHHYDTTMAILRQMMPQAAAGSTDWKDIQVGLANIRLNVAEVLQETQVDFEAARDSLYASLASYQELGSRNGIAKSFMLLGNNAYYRADYAGAKIYLDSTLAYGDALSKRDYNLVLATLGRIYLDQNQFKEAWGYISQALAAAAERGDSAIVSRVRYQVGSYYYAQARFDSSIHHLQLAIAQSDDNLIRRARILHLLADALEQAGQAEEAEEAARQYVALLSKFSVEDARAAFEELVGYQFERNRILTRAEREEKRSLQLASQKRTILLSAALAFAILLAFLGFLLRKNAVRRAEIAEQHSLLAKQREQIAWQEKEMAVQQRLELLQSREMERAFDRLEGQEAAQREIGQELHDSVGVMLSTVKLNLVPVDEVLDVLPSEKRRQYLAANRLLDDACEQIRQISHRLSCATLAKFGLKPQLEALADNISEAGQFQVELVTHGLGERLDYSLEIQLYRIIQELVNNIIKHAQASSVSLQANRFQASVRIIVEDDGIGFELEDAERKGGIGLHNLRARVEKLDGLLHIDSRAGRGTIVTIDIPLDGLS